MLRISITVTRTAADIAKIRTNVPCQPSIYRFQSSRLFDVSSAASVTPETICTPSATLLIISARFLIPRLIKNIIDAVSDTIDEINSYNALNKSTIAHNKPVLLDTLDDAFSPVSTTCSATLEKLESDFLSGLTTTLSTFFPLPIFRSSLIAPIADSAAFLIVLPNAINAALI